jgi:hypothetical protein
MRHLVTTILSLGLLIVPAFSQDPGDDPEHGVARLSLLSGDVAVRRGDSGEEIAAELNAPLVTRDHVFTDRGARAEIQLDWANIVRLGPDSEVRMARLADRDFRIEFAAGTMTFRVLRDSSAQVEISTPTASIRPKQKGTYRITVRDDFSTEITVRSGDTDVFVGREYSSLRAGQTLVVQGDPSNPARIFTAFLPQDDWDRWNESRDRDFERSDSYKYVSRDIYGADDLHGHGRWVYDSPHGWVWAPTVASTWAPYRVGRWYWADHYGWTWVSGDPWGWAPYHYGRWYHAPRHGWVWYPGAVSGPRHHWRPALVSFFGWGANVGNVNINFGFGNVGWVPLAPYEIYRPWYGRNVTVVNVVNNVNVINNYRNARFVNGHNGVTSVFARDFGRRQVNVNNFVFANDRELLRAGDVRGRVPFEPSQEARRLSERQITVRPPQRAFRDPQRNSEPQFVSRPDTSNRSGPQDRQDRERVLNQPRQEVRQEPRPERQQPSQGNARVLFGGVPQPVPSLPPNRQPDRAADAFRDRRSPEAAPAVVPPPRREEARPRAPQPAPQSAPAAPEARNRGLERAAEAGRRPDRVEAPPAARAPEEQSRPRFGAPPAPAAPRASQPAAAPAPAVGNSNRGNGRGRDRN